MTTSMKSPAKNSAHPIYAKAARGEYITKADLARLVRDTLKREFPGTKFSVTSRHSVDISWMDGPTADQVDAHTKNFQTRGFDGSIDMATYNTLWLYPDGSAHVAHGEGTEGSGGYKPEVIASPRDGSAILLTQLASEFVFTHRSMSPASYLRAIAEIRAKNYAGLDHVDWASITVTASDYNGTAVLKGAGSILFPGAGPSHWLDCEIGRLARSFDLR